MLPAAISESKSYGRSSISTLLLRLSTVRTAPLEFELLAGLEKLFAEEPPGMTALSFRPSRNPPPNTGSLISCPIVALPTSTS